MREMTAILKNYDNIHAGTVELLNAARSTVAREMETQEWFEQPVIEG
jgi:hypothetical protein